MLFYIFHRYKQEWVSHVCTLALYMLHMQIYVCLGAIIDVSSRSYFPWLFWSNSSSFGLSDINGELLLSMGGEKRGPSRLSDTHRPSHGCSVAFRDTRDQPWDKCRSRGNQQFKWAPVAGDVGHACKKQRQDEHPGRSARVGLSWKRNRIKLNELHVKMARAFTLRSLIHVCIPAAVLVLHL